MKSDRLLAILLLLQARGRMSARELADELEVTERTIYRDLSALSTAGVPVYTERGRNGGCALLEGYRADLTGLTAAEARALFTFGGRGVPAGADAGTGEGARDEADLRQALRKLLTALPAPQRPAAQAARDRTVVDARGWHQRDEATPALGEIREAVWQTRRLRLTYRASDSPDRRVYTVDPYGLLVKAGRWYLIGACDQEERIFRVSRVDSAERLPEDADRPPGARPRTALESAAATVRGARPRDRGDPAGAPPRGGPADPDHRPPAHRAGARSPAAAGPGRLDPAGPALRVARGGPGGAGRLRRRASRC